MKERNRRLFVWIGCLVLLAISCQALTGQPALTRQPAVSEQPALSTPVAQEIVQATATALPAPTSAATPAAQPTGLPAVSSGPAAASPDEPVLVTGNIPYTSPFFLESAAEPFVMLEDEAGFVKRDRKFVFRLQEQVIGPVIIHDDKTLTYSLSLPEVPEATMVDVDNNGKTDQGVQVFAIAYWSNTWDGPFLEERDGTGWSNAYSSTITDPNNKDEIKGGILMVWAPDNQQEFPTGFGADGLLFTKDDPVAPIPAGYNLVDLNQKPFKVYKQAHPDITLNEGEVAVNDYSKMSYADAFQALFEKASREYPFTKEKNINWQALHDEFTPRAQQAQTPDDFYRLIRDFLYAIPDAHVGMSAFNQQVFFQEYGGSFGLVLSELSDGSVIVTKVITGTAGDLAGIKVGAQILTWDQKPVSEAIGQVVPDLGHSFSTELTRRLAQVVFLTRVPPNTKVAVTFQNPGSSQKQEVTLTAQPEFDSLVSALSDPSQNALSLPIEAKILDGSGIGYIVIHSFSDDYNLMARLWDRYMHQMIDNKVPALIIDVRNNGGGSGGIALDFAGYFFSEEINLYRESYYNERLQKFEYSDYPAQIKPAPVQYDGPIALLVGPDCVSACEGFSYAMQYGGRSTVVGHYPTAGGFGEVGRGQYKLPDDIQLQFPTGRPETPDGKVLIEGVGVQPDITVPVTRESALGQQDTVLEAAVQALQKQIGK